MHKAARKAPIKAAAPRRGRKPAVHHRPEPSGAIAIDIPIADMLEGQRGALALNLEAMDRIDAAARDAALQAVADGKYNRDASSHVAWLAVQRTQVINALRQLEKHTRIQSQTPQARFALVLQYLRDETLTIEQVAELCAAIDHRRGGRAVLS